MKFNEDQKFVMSVIGAMLAGFTGVLIASKIAQMPTIISKPVAKKFDTDRLTVIYINGMYELEYEDDNYYYEVTDDDFATAYNSIKNMVLA